MIAAGPLSSLAFAPLLCAIPFALGGLAPSEALAEGISLCGWIIGVTIDAFAAWLPVAGAEPLDLPLSGLPGFVYAARGVADGGIGLFFAFTGALSLSAGLLNSLPLPPLDGGRLLFALLRSIIPSHGARLERITAAGGLIAILVLGVLVTLIDLLRIGSGAFPAA